MYRGSNSGSKGTERRRRWRARGAAYVEAILLVCFMIVIFAGVQYLARYFDAKQQALGTARRCAWIFSKDACFHDPDCGTPGHIACLPADCEEALGFTKGQNGAVEKEPNEELQTNIEKAENDAETQSGKATDGSDSQVKLKNGVNSKMGPMMQMVVGQSVTATATHHVDPPRLVPNAQKDLTVSYYMPCNLAHENAFDVAMDLFFDLLPGGL
jgi:hypothetical protein